MTEGVRSTINRGRRRSLARALFVLAVGFPLLVRSGWGLPVLLGVCVLALVAGRALPRLGSRRPGPDGYLSVMDVSGDVPSSVRTSVLATFKPRAHAVITQREYLLGRLTVDGEVRWVPFALDRWFGAGGFELAPTELRLAIIRTEAGAPLLDLLLASGERLELLMRTTEGVAELLTGVGVPTKLLANPSTHDSTPT